MKTKLKNKLTLLLPLLAAGAAYLWKLWEEGLGNLYYSAGVRSMGENFHAFFYNSLDSLGFISIDKPPLGLWIQVFFTKILGFNGMAIMLPQALAGILSVYLIYKIIRRRFGPMAGMISGFVLALTPIFAVISRNNTIDGLLILTLVIASDQTIKASEKSSMYHLLLACLFIGLGFNVKTFQAFMIVPSVFLTYFIFSREKIAKRIVTCILSLIILLTVSFSWLIAVDLTPAENRPYVGSSENNSQLDLAFGNNGIMRIFGRDPGGSFPPNRLLPPREEINKGPGGHPGPNEGEDNTPPDGNPPQGSRQEPPPGGFPGPEGKQGPPPGHLMGPGGEGGLTSILRLYNKQMAGQISWFLLPAIMVTVLCFIQIFRKKNDKRKENITLFYFALCFIPMFIYFSFSSGMAHRYYLAMIAPAIAALTGCGVELLFRKSTERKATILFLFLITAAAQVYIQSLHADWLGWLTPLCITLFAAAGGLLFFRLNQKAKNKMPLLPLAVLIFLPALWSFTPVIYGNNAQLPMAGPELENQKDHFDNSPDLSSLIGYLKKNKKEAAYIAVVPSAMSLGAELILQSNEPVMALGGFNGKDNPLSVADFKKMVNSGRVKYALTLKNRNPGLPGEFNREIQKWIVRNSTIVETSLWSESGEMKDIVVYRLN